jgi:hypothetical protein
MEEDVKAENGFADRGDSLSLAVNREVNDE